MTGVGAGGADRVYSTAMDARALDAVGEAIVVSDLAGRIVHWTPRAEALYGWTAAEVLGQDGAEVLAPESHRAQARAIIAQVQAGEPWSGQFPVRRRDGSALLVWVTYAPYRDAGGALVGAIGVSRDLAPVINAGVKLAPRADLGRVLATSLDTEQAAAEVARALVPAFADLCALVVLDEPDGPRWLTLDAADPAAAPLLRSIREAPLHPRARANAEEVMRTGRTKFVADHLAAIPADTDAYDADVTRLAPGATLIAPMVAHGHAIGILSFAMTHTSGRHFGPDDAAFAAEIGQQIGLAIDNARVHTELQRSKARLRLALAAAPVSLFTQDRDLRYTWLRSPLRPDLEQVLGFTDAELVPGDAGAAITRLKRAVLTTGRGGRAVVTAPVGDQIHHYDLTLEPVRNGAGAVVGVTGAAWDVTEQRHLMDKLAQAEAAVRQLIDAAPEPYFLSQGDGRFVDVNAATVALVGYSRDELLTMRVADLVIPEERGRAEALAAIPRGATVIHEWRLRRKTGEVVDIEVHGKVLADGRRQGFARDITDRKAAERAGARLLALEQRHGARLEQLSAAVLAIAPIDDRFPAPVRSVLRRIVDQAARLVGTDLVAIGLGDDPTEPFGPWLTHAPLAGEGEPVVPSPPAAGAAPDLAAIFPGIPLGAFLVTPIVGDGRVLGQLYLARRAGLGGFASDDAAVLTLLVAHGAIAIANARLYAEREAAVRAREELLAIVSHDLRNPLRAIELREELLARTHDSVALQDHARSVRGAVGAMRRLIQNLLDATSLGLEGLRLELGDHALAEIAAEPLELLGPVAASRGVRLAVALADLPRVRVDRERIAQTLYNLIGNALRFTPAGGEVVISATAQPDAIEIAVADSGPGIPAEDLPRVFDRYFTTATGHEGTGLGLYIAKGVVDAHGGRIWIDPTEVRGCTVRVSLPRAGVPPRQTR